MNLQEVQNGLMSHLMLVQKWYDCSRDEALEIIRQIQEDTAELTELYPELGAATAIPDPAAAAEAQRQHDLALVAAKQNGNGAAMAGVGMPGNGTMGGESSDIGTTS
jgi:hypothetical protein